ncbi:formate/nitrite transporter family protein [Candidatus Saccharibacteria bacterium]|nr:formate/nitrite transporter family protein [Candidatus Saccharibacteria bacterium]
MLAPAKIATKTIEIGQQKATLKWWKMFLLGIFAGMFIAFAATGATFGNVYGGKIAGACIFTSGLAMVVVAGSELFTGNNLILMAFFDGKISFTKLLKNWLFVYLGNFLGALFVAALVTVSGTFNQVSDSAIATAVSKTNLDFFDALLKGVACNILVCIAVWMSFSANTVQGKIAAVFFPVMLFVLCGFEHSIANMFYIPAGMLQGTFTGTAAPTIEAFLLHNLLPVTIGNLIGGAVIVASGYYLAYLPTKESSKTKTNK